MLMGVEEEFLLVDPESRMAVPGAAGVIARCASGQVTAELTRFQVETKSLPCADGPELAGQLLALRRKVAEAARAEGLRAIASGTPVLGDVVPPPITAGDRYAVGIENYGALHDEQSVCAVHVHLELPDRDRAVLVSNHLRPWLPTLIALMANSPYWTGRETGYASWRTLTRTRWPVAGPPPRLASYAEYTALLDRLTEAGVLVDPGTAFWDVRPSAHLPTLEIRVADVPATSAESTRFALLVRALVTALLKSVDRGDPTPDPSPEHLRAAYWRAARDGLSGAAIDPFTGKPTTAAHQLSVLADLTDPALLAPVDGAARQRAAHAAGGPRAVVDSLIALFES
jgi:glutamate---cysteine ligase / carboxylate-amine ligase